jgi:WD40 repeat protein
LVDEPSAVSDERSKLLLNSSDQGREEIRLVVSPLELQPLTTKKDELPDLLVIRPEMMVSKTEVKDSRHISTLNEFVPMSKISEVGETEETETSCLKTVDPENSKEVASLAAIETMSSSLTVSHPVEVSPKENRVVGNRMKTPLLIHPLDIEYRNITVTSNDSLELLAVQDSKGREDMCKTLETENEMRDRRTIPDSKAFETEAVDSPTPVSQVVDTPPVGEKEVSPVQARSSYRGYFDNMSEISWDPVGYKIAASQHQGKVIQIYDGKTSARLQCLQGHSKDILSVSFNHDGSQIASGAYDHTVRVWDVSTGKELHTLRGHSGRVHSVAWNHDSSKIASGSRDKTIRIWHWTKATFSMFGDGMCWKVLITLKHSNSISFVSWNHAGTKILSKSYFDNKFKIWDCSTGKELTTLKGQCSDCSSMYWSHDDSKLVSSSGVSIWNAASGEVMKSLEGNSEYIHDLAWSPDDRKIAACSNKEQKIIIWDALTAQVLKTIEAVEYVKLVSWSRDGSELVAICDDHQKIKVFSV